MNKILLCIMDGVGERLEKRGNAFLEANTPYFDYLKNNYSHILLNASGKYVGLPDDQMGNSEVGHITIGSGRIIEQPLTFINKKINNNEFYNNQIIKESIDHAKNSNSKLHLIGLLSDGGVHSHINHLKAILNYCKKENFENVYLHLITDGRDTSANSSIKYFNEINSFIKEINIGKIASISGRYYAMDRDNRWDRIAKFYEILTNKQEEVLINYEDHIKENYYKNITDEFIEPIQLESSGIIENNDSAIIFNFRPDRLKQLLTVFVDNNFNKHETKKLYNLKIVSMLPVLKNVESIFHLDKVDNSLGEYISKLNKKQLRISETEKYAHVTYFFDGGKELDLNNCKKILIPSPSVTTYDLKPEMASVEITNILLKELSNNHDLIILNFANGDMLGHTGNYKKAIESIEVMDKCLQRIHEECLKKDITLIVTSDHGNCEYMLDNKNNKVTSHTTNLVNFIICKKYLILKNGSLSDIAPTILDLMEIDKPKEMTGISLIIK